MPPERIGGRLAAKVLIVRGLHESNRSKFERLVYNNRLIVNHLTASPSRDTTLAVNPLTLNILSRIPRSKNERGL